jgi:hypothetical protein
MSGRFVDLETMDPKMACAIDRKMAVLGGLVEDDHSEVVTHLIVVTYRYNETTGQVVPTYRQYHNTAPGPWRSAGYIRNGQLQFAGTGDMSDSDPEP